MLLTPEFLQLLVGAGLTIAGWFARHYLGAPSAAPAGILSALSPALAALLQQHLTTAQLTHDMQLLAPLLAQHGLHAPAVAVAAPAPAAK